MKKKHNLVKAPVESIPEAITEAIPEAPKQTDVFRAKVIQQAKNPQWVFCVAVGRDLGKINVAIPRRLTNKLVDKFIEVEAITDHTGVSYRYVEGQPH